MDAKNTITNIFCMRKIKNLSKENILKEKLLLFLTFSTLFERNFFRIKIVKQNEMKKSFKTFYLSFVLFHFYYSLSFSASVVFI